MTNFNESMPDWHPELHGVRYGEHRAFLLALDPTKGHEFAEEMGFTPASASVAHHETKAVMKEWMTMSALGLDSEIETYIDWFLKASSVTKEQDMPPEVRTAFVETLRAFATATIISLKRRDMLSIDGSHLLVFEEARMNPETGDIVAPNTALHEAIEELESVLLTPAYEKPPPLAPPTGERFDLPGPEDSNPWEHADTPWDGYDDEDFASLLEDEEDH